MTTMTMICTCPKDWPQSIMRDFGEYADEVAIMNRIPLPRFGVTAHQAPCDLPDAPHTIPDGKLDVPDDYAAPGYIWDWDNPVPVVLSKNPRSVVSVAFPSEQFQAVAREARQQGKKLSAFIREAALRAAKR